MNIKKIEFDYINNKITFITDENYKYSSILNKKILSIEDFKEYNYNKEDTQKLYYSYLYNNNILKKAIDEFEKKSNYEILIGHNFKNYPLLIINDKTKNNTQIYSEEINMDEFLNYDDWIIDFNIIRNNIIKIF
jgi:hypothetical protein